MVPPVEAGGGVQSKCQVDVCPIESVTRDIPLIRGVKLSKTWSFDSGDVALIDLLACTPTNAEKVDPQNPGANVMGCDTAAEARRGGATTNVKNA
jgi:hypothetical protein